MTRARSLKQIIRARAAKTGERYTTARRHVLAQLAHGAPPPAPPTRVKPAAVKAHPSAAAKPTAKGSVSDDKAREKTGYGLDHWFAVLDAFGAVEQGHTAAARHLNADHGVEGWYSQGITVAYERARGVRAVNQRCDGAYEVSASKVVPAEVARVVQVFRDSRLRARWLAGVDPQLGEELSTALANGGAKGVVEKPNGQARMRLKWNGTVAQFNLYPKPGNKVSVSVQHSKLPTAASVELWRGQWRAALAALAEVAGGQRRQGVTGNAG